MIITDLLSSMAFTGGEIAAISILASVLGVALITNGVMLALFRNKKAKQQPQEAPSEQPQSQDLGAVDEQPDYGETAFAEEPEEEQEEALQDDEPDDDEDDVDDDDIGDDDGRNFAPVVILGGKEEEDEFNANFNAEILAVKDMSDTTRKRLGFVGEEYDRKRYYVRYRLSFNAKLREADSEIQHRYKTFVEEVGKYKGVKIKESFRQQRIYKGRKTLGLILFRGKTLCVAFALNPADYEGTKYRGIDKSDKKRFEKTPMLYKLSSERKTEYSKYLFAQVAASNSILTGVTPEKYEYDFSEKTRDQLFVDKKLQIKVLGEAPELDYAGEKVYEEEITEELPERDFEIFEEIAISDVDVMSDEDAEQLVEDVIVRREKPKKRKKDIINIDTLSAYFEAGAFVTLESLKEKKLIGNDVNYLKVLARGTVNKPLIVEADDFSLPAVKMIVLTGGRVIRRTFIG